MNKQETCIASSVVTAREANTLIPFSFDCNALFYHAMLPPFCSLSVILSAGNCNTHNTAPGLFSANLQFGSLSKRISPSPHMPKTKSRLTRTSQYKHLSMKLEKSNSGKTTAVLFFTHSLQAQCIVSYLKVRFLA